MEGAAYVANVRKEFGSENLDKILRYFMRTVIRMEKSGMLSLPVENDLKGEPLRSYLELCMRFVTDAQPEEVSRPILESQYDFILNNSKLPPETALEMWICRELSLHIHYDRDPYEFIFHTGNLWGDLANEFACRTFYPNMPAEMQEKYGVDEIVKHIPEGLLRPEDY